MTTNINQGIKTVLYSAADINRAKALFTKLLGVEPSVVLRAAFSQSSKAADRHSRRRKMSEAESWWQRLRMLRVISLALYRCLDAAIVA